MAEESWVQIFTKQKMIIVCHTKLLVAKCAEERGKYAESKIGHSKMCNNENAYMSNKENKDDSCEEEDDNKNVIYT